MCLDGSPCMAGQNCGVQAAAASWIGPVGAGGCQSCSRSRGTRSGWRWLRSRGAVGCAPLLLAVPQLPSRRSRPMRGHPVRSIVPPSAGDGCAAPRADSGMVTTDGIGTSRSRNSDPCAPLDGPALRSRGRQVACDHAAPVVTRDHAAPPAPARGRVHVGVLAPWSGGPPLQGMHVGGHQNEVQSTHAGGSCRQQGRRYVPLPSRERRLDLHRLPESWSPAWARGYSRFAGRQPAEAGRMYATSCALLSICRHAPQQGARWGAWLVCFWVSSVSDGRVHLCVFRSPVSIAMRWALHKET